MALTDREKIIKGLECCISETQCHKCPYRGECDDKGYYYSKAIDDAIALLKDDETQLQYRDDVIGCEEDEVKRLREILKEQEPRVMTLDELTEIYVEFKGNACPIRLSNFDLQKIIMYVSNGICRLWTGKPTDEQRKAAKWDD